jgi:cytochrome c oxidase assembly factor CtaG
VPELLLTSAGLVAAWAAYDRGRERLGRRAPGGAAPGLFAGGLAVVGVALVSPLDGWALRWFSAHMVQHLLLLAVAPPLLVAGAPAGPLAAGVPASLRRAAAALERISRPAGAGRPAWVAGAVAVQLAVVVGWHVPAAYEAALAQRAVHAAEHVSFLGAGLAFWWSVIGLRRRSAYGVGVLALFVTALVNSALGAAITTADSVWYRQYGSGAAPLADQQLAGVVMWAWAGLVTVVAAMTLFALWLSGYDRTSPAWRKGGPP